MATPKTDFAADDFAIARRAQWLLDGNPPGREQPPLDVDLNRFDDFVGTSGCLEPLAHFGQSRLDDALLAAKPSAGAATGPALPRDSSIHRNRAVAEACASERRANDELREARARIRNARRHWHRAAELRAEADNKIAVLALDGAAALLLPTGKHQDILEAISSLDAAVDRTVAAVGPSMRRLIEGDPFPSTLGLPTAERAAALNDQAVHLFDGGVSLLAIAYAMGWYEDAHEMIEAIQDKTSKRIAGARSRRGRADG